jgi:predicted nucleotidyltransferase component of viral defense system
MINKSAANKELLDIYYELKNEYLFKDYILGGGTALALQIGHRTSTDIDIFTTKKKSNKDILNKLNELYHTYYIINMSEPVLETSIKNIKVDFINDNSNILEIPKTNEKITYFGIKDISAMKLRAILTRTKARDYIDIAYLLKHIPLNKMFNNYKQKYKQDDITIIKLALSKCNTIPDNEWDKDINMLDNSIVLTNIPKLINNELLRYNKRFIINTNIFNTIKDNIKKMKRK